MSIAIYSAIFLAALVGLSLIGQLIRRKNGDTPLPSSQKVEEAVSIASPEPEAATDDDDDDECCGEHEVCEKGKIKRALCVMNHAAVTSVKSSKHKTAKLCVTTQNTAS